MKKSKKKNKYKTNKLASTGLEPMRVMTKTLCLNLLTIRPKYTKARCKYCTCFSWLQNSYITFMLTRLINITISLCIIIRL